MWMLHDEGYTGDDPVNDDVDTYDVKDTGEERAGFLTSLVENDDDLNEEPSVITEPRTFCVKWECLLPLITCKSCANLKRLTAAIKAGNHSHNITTTPMDDLQASQSNGFMGMLRMYLSRSLTE